MAKRQKRDSSTETAALAALERGGNRQLERFICGHVGTEIGVKAKAFVRWAEARTFSVLENTKKCPDCK